MHIVDLGGTWDLRQEGAKAAVLAEVPGVVHTDLYRSGRIPDPFYGCNEAALQWIGEADWVYERTFEVDDALLAQLRVSLECDGLDTVARVYINDELIGRSDSMFLSWRFDVKKALRAGTNTIRIVLESAARIAKKRAASYPYPVPYSSHIIEHVDHRNFLRKAQCHSGWDWGPAYATCGIYRGIRIVGGGNAVLRYVSTHQQHATSAVTVEVEAFLEAASEGNHALRFSLDGQAKTLQVSATPGLNRISAVFGIKSPRRWWPVGYGEQPLYELEVQLDGESSNISKRIGLREVEIVQEPDGDGERFYLKVNGVAVFAKGANWIPADCFTSRIDKARYDDLLGSAVAANHNVIRVWGGGYYEDDYFYDWCDEHGLMVWQDFMFACAMYPVDDAFLDSVRQEVRHQVRRLMSHPSIALWCGNNENEQALHWYRESLENRDKYLADYDQLYMRTIYPIVREEDPERSFWPSSPSNGPGVYGNAQDVTRGDQHYWQVWHGRDTLHSFLKLKPRFNSEFGFQSFSSIETTKTFAAPEDMNPSSPVMERHQRSIDGNIKILTHLLREYRQPKDFASLCYMSQVLQGEGIKRGCEHWRRLRPYCMGIVYWQLNDIWPVTSWSSIEYDGRWKLMHHMSKRFFAPVLISAKTVDTQAATPIGATGPDLGEPVCAGGGVEIWGTNDQRTPVAGELTAELRSFDGKIHKTYRRSVRLARASSRRLFRIPSRDLFEGNRTREDVFLSFRLAWDGKEQENYLFFAPLKRVNLPAATVRCAVKQARAGFDVAVTASKPALFVALSAGNIPGRFSDNAFQVYPDRPVRVSFTPKEETTLPSFEEALYVRHLRDSYV
ncbi:MAG: glycoside hydrolase family 2 protein [Nitrospiraceae bacterium]|nr:glycoside hydrolase family 2 protein [Nitrospiraceae bacterium]